MNRTQKTEEYCDLLQSINTVYEDYSRSEGITYTTLYVFSLIQDVENCTQRKICEQTFLPKQTVNTIVTNFYKSGLVQLKEVPDNRRMKTIHLTKAGEEYAQEHLSRLHKAEREAMHDFSRSRKWIN